jgi:hypothetical protein
MNYLNIRSDVSLYMIAASAKGVLTSNSLNTTVNILRIPPPGCRIFLSGTKKVGEASEGKKTYWDRRGRVSIKAGRMDGERISIG